MSLADSVHDPFAALEREGLIEDITAVAAGTEMGARSAVASLAASVAPDAAREVRGLNLVRLAPGASLREVQRRLDDIAAVTDIERVPYRTVVPLRSQRPRPNAALPWNLSAIGWSARQPPNAADIRVAVLDTGVDDTHPQLSIASYSHEGVSSEDIVGHGTHVCGIVAGASAQHHGYSSGVSNAALHVWKIFEDQPNQDGDYLVDEVLYLRALRAAQTAGCQVMNLSIGGSATTRAELAMFQQIIRAGVIVVAAMGNEYLDGNPVEYPAAHADVIAVGAVDTQLRRASFSNTGNHITLIAPGVSIWSTLPVAPSAARTEVSYASWDGTSMATPHVVAAVARWLASGTATDRAGVLNVIQTTSKKLPAMGARGWTRQYGHGLLQL